MPLLCYITGPRGVARVAEAFAAGVDMVQVRAKDASTRELREMTALAVAGRAAAMSRSAGAAGSGTLLVNTRADVAIVCAADGVHLPAGSPPAAAYKSIVRIVSVACHSVEDVQRAAAESADYAVLAPTFETPGKGVPLGLAQLERAARVGIPVVALGGITLENAASCFASGAGGIAAIRLFEDALDICAVVRSLRASLGAA